VKSWVSSGSIISVCSCTAIALLGSRKLEKVATSDASTALRNT